MIVVAGARPNFMKIAPPPGELDCHGQASVLVDTGQHYAAPMGGVLFEVLANRAPSLHLEVGSGPGGAAGPHGGVRAGVLAEEPSWVVVPGDVNSIVARGQVEADGPIALLCSASVCINTGGEKAFLEEVKEAFKTHDDGRNAVAVGVPHEKLDEAIVAVVELRPHVELDEAAIINHVKERLAAYEAPKRMLHVETIGRGPNGKVDNNRLKQDAATEVARASEIAFP